jgi:hypothetical protein
MISNIFTDNVLIHNNILKGEYHETLKPFESTKDI